MKWLRLWWWRHLFASRGWHNAWCRMRGHPGVVWYDPGGLEPDMHCRRCGEDLG